MRQNNRKLYGLAQGAMIAAIYVALTMVFAPISFGPVQNRGGALHTAVLYAGSRARTICGLPAFQPALRGHAPGRGIRKPGHAYWRSRFMVSEKAQVVRVHSSNYGQHHYHSMGVRYAYGSEDMILMAMVTVGIGEILAIGVLGNTLLIILERYKNLVFRQQAA